MPSLVLTNGAIVSVVQPTAARITVTEPARELRVVALPPGAGGGSVGYEHIQAVAAATWTIILPLGFGRRPVVELYVADVQVETDMVWTPVTNTLTITFPSPTSGVAVIA